MMPASSYKSLALIRKQTLSYGASIKSGSVILEELNIAQSFVTFLFSQNLKVHSQKSCSATHDSNCNTPILSNFIIPFTPMPSGVYSWTFCMQFSSLPYVVHVQPIMPSYSLVDCHLLKPFNGKTLGKHHKISSEKTKKEIWG